MKGLIRYLLNTLKVLLKIFLVLVVLGAFTYFALVKYADYRMQRIGEEDRIRREEHEKAAAEFNAQKAKEKSLKEESAKTDAFTACMNKAYRDYDENWSNACAELNKANGCLLTPQKLYEVQEYYKAAKQDCEKLKQ